jgi:hypothetical protein
MSNYNSRFPIYAALLKLYPSAHRKRYEQEILQTTADMLDDAPSRLTRVRVWTHVAFDLPLNIVRQQVSYGGDVMSNETPRYLKRSSLIAGALLLPFILALLANGLSKLINKHGLDHSWLWKSPAIGIWILYLPEVALLLALATYIVYIVKGTDGTTRSWLKSAVDVRHVWPIMLPAVLALGVLFLVAFHDSVQCWAQNPVHAVTHMQQTWQCTVKNQSLKGIVRL